MSISSDQKWYIGNQLGRHLGWKWNPINLLRNRLGSQIDSSLLWTLQCFKGRVWEDWSHWLNKTLFEAAK